MAAKFGLFVYEDHSKLPTLYWLPKLHKRPYKSRFIANSSACTTTELSILLTSCLPAIKNHVGIPMGTNCAPLVADLSLFCYERDFMLSLSDNNQADIIEAFNCTSRYLDDLLNIDNSYFEQMVGRIYPTELQLNKANSSDTEAPFSGLNLSITKGIVSSKIYDNAMILI